MGLVNATGDVAAAATTTVGALAGGAVGGVIGAVGGALKGIGKGLGTGAPSTPAALLGVVAVGATGLLDWPVLIAGSAALLILRRLRMPPAATPPAPVPNVANPDLAAANPDLFASDTDLPTATRRTGGAHTRTTSSLGNSRQ